MKAVCQICWRHCTLEEGQTGFCQARSNQNGRILCSNYGSITALALDPVEKKPLTRFMPGSMVLSVGSYGCNYACAFCQNAAISQARGQDVAHKAMMPQELVQLAYAYQAKGNIGLAYTYNEPLIGYEFVRDCAMQIRSAGMKNIVVTNGSVSTAVLAEMLPYIDAMNIDLKAFHEGFYQNIGGDLHDVKRFIEMAVRKCHVEITALIIPGKNDSEEEMQRLSLYLSQLNPEIPLYVSRFFPRYRMQDRKAAPAAWIYHLAEVARQHLRYVYPGNC